MLALEADRALSGPGLLDQVDRPQNRSRATPGCRCSCTSPAAAGGEPGNDAAAAHAVEHGVLFGHAQGAERQREQVAEHDDLAVVARWVSAEAMRFGDGISP